MDAGSASRDRRRPPRRWRLARGTVVLCLVLGSALLASPAGAEVVEGSCTGVVTMADEVVIDSTVPGAEVVTVPPEGTVTWSGSAVLDTDEPVPVDGVLRARYAFGWIELSSWSGQAVAGEATGTERYEVPSVVPRGSGPIPLEVALTIGDEPCRIIGTIALEGATFDPLSVVALVVTVALLLAVVAAGRADTRGRGRPVLGLAAGAVAGAAGAATLFGVGVLPLDSGAWWILPVLVAALGLALGAAAPFARHAQDDDAAAASSAPSDPPSGPPSAAAR